MTLFLACPTGAEEPEVALFRRSRHHCSRGPGEECWVGNGVAAGPQPQIKVEAELRRTRVRRGPRGFYHWVVPQFELIWLNRLVDRRMTVECAHLPLRGSASLSFSPCSTEYHGKQEARGCTT